MSKRWVVILNKSPKGPLTENEVKTLIDQKFLRLNDLAFEVDPESTAATSDWKLLWQFPEFNRRGTVVAPGAPEPVAAPTPQEPAPTPKAERRAAIPPEEQKRRALQALPEDLAAINPEDLVTKKKVSPLSLDEPLGAETARGERRSFPALPVAAAGAALLVVALWIAFGRSTGTRSTASREGTSPPVLERPIDVVPQRIGAPAHFQKNPTAVLPPSSAGSTAPAAREGNPFQLNNPNVGNTDSGRIDYRDPAVFDEGESEDEKVLEESAFKDKSRRGRKAASEEGGEALPEGASAPSAIDDEPVDGGE